MPKHTPQALDTVIERGLAYMRAEVGPPTAQVALLAKCWAVQLDVIEKTIKFKDGKYCVTGKTGKSFGCFPTKKKAAARLKMIERFSKAASAAAVGLAKELEEILEPDAEVTIPEPEDAIATALSLIEIVPLAKRVQVSEDHVSWCAQLYDAANELIDVMKHDAPADGATQAQLLELRAARAARFGIEVVEKGSNLAFQEGFPETLEQYADPVNLRFPIDKKGRADNARAKFKRNADSYKKPGSKKAVHKRIVEAQLKFDSDLELDLDDPLDQMLPATVRERVKTEKARYAEKQRKKTEKGLPDETPQSGIHIHGLERELSRTKRDGQHSHIFQLEKAFDLGEDMGTIPVGALIWTDEDAAHSHALPKETSDVTANDGEHFHGIRLPGGKLIETSDDGAHKHQGQVATTAFDGLHSHVLELSNQKLKSIMPGEFWDMHGRPDQAHLPLVPPARLMAWLHPAAREALMAMQSVETLKSLAGKDKPEAERSDYRTGEISVLKMPDPEFTMKRLQLHKTAGLVSTRCRKSRVGESQALVNELGPGKFTDSFIWGFVAYEEAELHKSLADMPETLRAGIDPHTLSEFEDVSDIYYMPIRLVKAAENPLKLLQAPAGRRFAGKIDLAKDTVEIAKCSKCEKKFETAQHDISVCAECRKATYPEQSSVAKNADGGRVSRSVRVVKADEDDVGERYIKGVVLVPDDADGQGDIYGITDVRKAAHTFMEFSGGEMNIQHKGEVIKELKVLETYLSSVKETHGDETFPIGTWFLAVRAPEDIHKAAKAGDFTGFSIEGSALREALS